MKVVRFVGKGGIDDYIAMQLVFHKVCTILDAHIGHGCEVEKEMRDELKEITKLYFESFSKDTSHEELALRLIWLQYGIRAEYN